MRFSPKGHATKKTCLRYPFSYSDSNFRLLSAHGRTQRTAVFNFARGSSDGREDFDDSPFWPSNACLRDRTPQIAESNPTHLPLRARIVMKRIVSELEILAESFWICLPGPVSVATFFASAPNAFPRYITGITRVLHTSCLKLPGIALGSCLGTRGQENYAETSLDPHEFALAL